MTDEQLEPAPRKRPRQEKPDLQLVTPEQKQETAAPTRKIAVLGSAVSSVGLAPFNDPSWEIWGCSPANKSLPRVDFWFELHNWEVKRREGLTEWLEFLKTKPRVFVQEQLKKTEDFPGAIAYPLEHMLKKYGPFWWTSQVSFMLALALEQQPLAIGLYGVDMAANSEYNQQRLACQYFIQKILDANINLIVPPESDLLEPAPLYGYCESSRHWRKLRARELELRGRIADCQATAAQKEQEAKHLIGALDDLQYNQAHWTNRRDFY